MDHLKTLLTKRLHQRGLLRHAEAAQIVHIANVWMQEKNLSAFARASQFKDAVLVIECDHSVALQECAQNTEELREHLSEVCAETQIRDIRCIRS